MARPVTKCTGYSRRNIPVVPRRQQYKPVKINDFGGPPGSREGPFFQHEWSSTKNQKPKKTISTTGLLKRVSRIRHRDRKSRHRESRSESTLYNDFQVGMEKALGAIGATTKNTFDAAYADHMEVLQNTMAEDDRMAGFVSSAKVILGTSLVGEKVETVIKRNGKYITEIVEIDERVASLKKTVSIEEANLAESWKQWEDLQNEYLELGIEVLGAERFGEGTASAKYGFKKEMELLDLEYKTRSEELLAEVQDLSSILERLKESEEELKAAARDEQRRLLNSLEASSD